MDASYQKLIRLADTISMREMDRHALEDLGIQGLVLMENAARSVADWLTENKLKNDPDARIVVCCGKGNNGGDGFAIARLLANRGYDIHVVDAGEAKKGDDDNDGSADADDSDDNNEFECSDDDDDTCDDCSSGSYALGDDGTDRNISQATFSLIQIRIRESQYPLCASGGKYEKSRSITHFGRLGKWKNSNSNWNPRFNSRRCQNQKSGIGDH